MQRSNGSQHNISSIKKLKLHGRPGTIALSERKGSFIEDDMPRNNDSDGREVKAAVSFMVSGVAQEDAQGGVRGEFVGGCGRQVGIAFATEDSKVTIRWGSPKEGMVRRGESEGLGWQNVNQDSRRGKSLDPIGGRHGGLKQQGANNIINRANNAFSFTVLGRGVRAGHAKMNALGEEERPSAGVIKLLSVVALNRLD